MEEILYMLYILMKKKNHPEKEVRPTVNNVVAIFYICHVSMFVFFVAVLRFYGPVNTIKVMLSQSFNPLRRSKAAQKHCFWAAFDLLSS